MTEKTNHTVNVETAARAMTPNEKHAYLIAAGWRTNQWRCWHGEKRPPERWGPTRDTDHQYTLGQAIRQCLSEERHRD